MEKIIKDISTMMSQQKDTHNKILVIRVQEIDHYAGDPLLPKIEYKEGDSFT